MESELNIEYGDYDLADDNVLKPAYFIYRETTVDRDSTGIYAFDFLEIITLTCDLIQDTPDVTYNLNINAATRTRLGSREAQHLERLVDFHNRLVKIRRLTVQ